MPGDHAILSPSGASRWLACTPSARLEEKFPESTSAAAEEGSLAHKLGEAMLRKFFGLLTYHEYLVEFKKIEANPLYGTDMMSYADDYATYVIECFNEAKTKTPDAIIQIEQSLNLTDYVPEGFGTGDAIIIADGTLSIIDLKYGKGVPVSCENNKQMMLYALGALREFDYVYDINTVSMTIYQPRLDNISTFEMSVDELRAWAVNELKPLAELAFKGEGEFVPGKHCQFCKAKVKCRALADENMRVAALDFDDPALLDDNEIAGILLRVDQVKKWLTAVEDYAFNEAVENGKKWPGFKLVEGRSVRAYADQLKVAETLAQNGYAEEVIYAPRTLLGITAMEKVLTKKNFEALLSGLVVKPQGKPTLVPETDKRPEWNSTESAFEDFK